MRCDIISIFPSYLEPLNLSLPGQAQRKGLLEIDVHDLRDFTHDRHRTVDDSPFGGGAGMVMKPEPWWEALEHVRSSADGVPTLVVPGPGGEVLTQKIARELASEPWLVFACGRYEGIDERVYEAAAAVMPVRVISLGDYVLNGGEVAALAIIEAAARLLPGFMGNAESLVEESHEDGLLEYPVYTKPSSWQGRDVPEVLLSGDHGKIAQWRHEQRLERTARRRPDLLPTSALMSAADLVPRVAGPADQGELLTLGLACFGPSWMSGGHASAAATTWVVHAGSRLIAAVRTSLVHDESAWHIDNLMVAPDRRREGIATALLKFAEKQAPRQAQLFVVGSQTLVSDEEGSAHKGGVQASHSQSPFTSIADNDEAVAKLLKRAKYRPAAQQQVESGSRVSFVKERRRR